MQNTVGTRARLSGSELRRALPSAPARPRVDVCGDGSEASGLEVLYCLTDLGLGVHDEGPVLDDGFADRPAAQNEGLERTGRGLLFALGTDRNRVTLAEQRHLVRPNGVPVDADGTLAVEDVDHRRMRRVPGDR